VIARNLARKQKRLFTSSWAASDSLSHRRGRAPRGRLGGRAIKKLELDAAPSTSFAIFYRTHAQSRSAPGRGVPGRRHAVHDHRRHAILRPHGDQGSAGLPAGDRQFRRRSFAGTPSSNKPTRGIGESTYERCVEKARAERKTVFEAMRQIAAPQMELLGDPAEKEAGRLCLINR